MKKELVETFKECVFEFCEKYRLQIVDCKTEEKDKKYVSVGFEFPSAKVEFIYNIKERVFCPASTLYCRIYPRKNNNVYFHIPEIAQYILDDIYKCFYFPYIENPQRMRNCFAYLFETIIDALPRIYSLIQDEEKYRELLLKKESLLVKEFNIRKSYEFQSEYYVEEDVLGEYQDMYENSWLLYAFTRFDGYQLFLIGKYEKAKMAYEKLLLKRQPDVFSAKLLKKINELIANGEEYTPLELECRSEIDARMGSMDGRTFLMGVMCVLIAYAVFFIVFSVFLFCLIKLFASDITFLAGVKWYDSLWLAGNPGLWGGIAFRKQISSLVLRRKANPIIDFDKISTPKAINGLAYGFFAVVTVLTIVLSSCSLCCSALFYEDRVKFPASDVEFTLEMVTKKYSEIDKIFFVEARYNEYGDRIERSSYVLKFNDSTMLDLDGYTSVEETETFILSLLPKDIEITYVDSERNIE